MRTTNTIDKTYLAEIVKDGQIIAQYNIQGKTLSNAKLTESAKKKRSGTDGLLLVRAVETGHKTKVNGEFACQIYRLGKGEIEIGEPTEFKGLHSKEECIEKGHKHHSRYDCLGYKIVVEHEVFGEVDCQTFMF